MKEEILISIIVPVYNVEQYLVECLESILRQSYKNYEVICIDDVSTDNSSLILEQYSQKYKCIKIFKNLINKGLSYNRNRGIDEANGEYIIFVDSDDMIKENTLKLLVEQIEEKQKPDIIYYDMEEVLEGVWKKERIIFKKNQHNYRNDIYVGKDLYCQLEKNDELIVEACRQIIRKKFLEEQKITFYEKILHEDNLFSFYCAMKAEKVMYFQEKLYIYRRRDDSIMSSMNIKRVQSYFIVLIELWNYWKNGSWTEEIEWLFKNVLSKLYKQFYNALAYYPNEELKELGTKADQFMYEVIRNSLWEKFEYVDLNQDEIQDIKNASKVMVYGAGGVGIDVVRFLQKENINVKNIIVSNRKSNAEMVLGVPVVQFEDVDFDEETLVIVAILRSNKNAIVTVVNNLKCKNISKIMMYDGKLEKF